MLYYTILYHTIFYTIPYTIPYKLGGLPMHGRGGVGGGSQLFAPPSYKVPQAEREDRKHKADRKYLGQELPREVRCTERISYNIIYIYIYIYLL